MTTLGTLEAKLELDSKGFREGIDDAKKSTEGLEKEAEKAQTGIGGNFTALAGIATTAGAAIATAFGVVAVGAIGALGAVTYSSLQEFIGFEKGMSEVFTLLPDMSAEARTKMTEDVQQLSTELGVLPEKVIPALYQAISAGVPTDNVFEFLSTAQMAAVGGVTDLETAVDGISSVVNAYGSDVISAGQASDLMFTAVRAGKTTFADLSGNLFNVIPVASSLGVAFGDVTAAVATMTAQGTPTSVATTQMRQMLVELGKDGGETAKVFEELSGKSFADFIAEGGNVQDALGLLSKYASENGLRISDLFGSVEAGNAALALTGKGAEIFGKNLDMMANSGGATEKAFNTMEESSARAIERMQANWANMKLDLAQKLEPALSSIMGTLEQFMNNPELQGMWEGLTDGIAVFGKWIADNLPGWINSFIAFKNGLAQFGSEAGGVFNQFVAFLQPITDAVGRLVTMALGGLSSWWAQWGPAITANIKTFIDAFISIYAQVYPIIRDLIANGLNLLADWFTNNSGTIGEYINVLTSVLVFLGTVFVWVFKNILVPVIVFAGTVLYSVIAFIIGVFVGFHATVWAIFANIVVAVAKFVTGFADGFVKAFNAVRDFITKITAQFKGMSLVDIGKNLIEGLFNGISNATNWLYTKLSGWVTNVLDYVKKLFGIASPSKITEYYGEMLNKGLAVGIEGTVKMPEQAFQVPGIAKLDAAVSSVSSGTVNKYYGSVNLDLSGRDAQDLFERVRVI